MFDQKQNKALASLKYLWKVDDSAWIDERKSQWKQILQNGFTKDSAKVLKLYAKYFVYGEKTEYIGSTILFLLTPYTSAESALKVFNSDLFGAHERSKVFSSYLSFSAEYVSYMPWFKNHTKCFIEGVLGSTYSLIEEGTGGGKPETISTEPTSWVERFYLDVVDILEGEYIIEHHGYLDCIDYFISCLPHSTKKNMRRFIDWNSFFDLIDDVLEGGGTPLALEFSKKLKPRQHEIIEGWALNAELDPLIT